MASATDSPAVVVCYSRQGKEWIWCGIASRDASDGPAAAVELKRRFAEDVRQKLGIARSLVSQSVSGNVGSSEAVRLRVVPAKPGGPQCEVAPVLGQSLAGFLEHTCRDDHGAFQLRAQFDAPSSEAFVLIRVAFPGTAPTPASGSSGGELPPMIVEQFECAATSTIVDLKNMLHFRTRFPMNQEVLLLGCKRLNNELQMCRVAAAADAANTPLQMHIAAEGTYIFLSREGQGHCEPSGCCTLTLHLPHSVQASRVRPMKFDLEQRLKDFRMSVQAVSGLHPASLQFKIIGGNTIDMSLDTGTLQSLGFCEDCAVEVTTGPQRRGTAEVEIQSGSHEVPMDTPCEGSAATLYDRAASKLGLADASRLSLFIGKEAVNRNSDLSCTSLADGAILSAYVSWPLQLSFSALTTNSSALCASSSSSSSAAGDASNILPATVACLSSDTIEEVRERIIGVVASAQQETAGKLRNCKIFAVENSTWASSIFCRPNTSKLSFGCLANILGGFVHCSNSARLSRLGIADGGAHLVLVAEQSILVEILIHMGEDCITPRKLRVSTTLRLTELSNLLYKSLEEEPIIEHPLVQRGQIRWALASSLDEARDQASHTNVVGTVSDGPSLAPSPSRGVAAMVGSAAAVVKRKSFRGHYSPEASSTKKRRINVGSLGLVDELVGDEFVGDLHVEHAAQQQEVPPHFLCPISYETMRDPVVVNGSGNTYDRKSIERHLEVKHTDPITNTELPRSRDRKLVPNNALRSLIDEAERSIVDLRLIALIGGWNRRTCLGDAGMASNLQWFTSLLRGGS